MRQDESTPDHYTYDPLDTRPGELETPDFVNVLTDQRLVLNTFGNGVIYQSDPFDEDTEITGAPALSMWMVIDVPDTDFLVTLYEVMATGASVLLAEDILRARYRDSLEVPTLVPPGEAIRYDFKTLPFFSRLVARGSRLRLFLRCPNSIYYQKNYNGGQVVADETSQGRTRGACERVSRCRASKRPCRADRLVTNRFVDGRGSVGGQCARVADRNRSARRVPGPILRAVVEHRTAPGPHVPCHARCESLYRRSRVCSPTAGELCRMRRGASRVHRRRVWKA